MPSKEDLKAEKLALMQEELQKGNHDLESIERVVARDSADRAIDHNCLQMVPLMVLPLVNWCLQNPDKVINGATRVINLGTTLSKAFNKDLPTIEEEEGERGTGDTGDPNNNSWIEPEEPKSPKQHPKEVDKQNILDTQKENTLGRIQSRINLETKGMGHVTSRHFSGKTNANQFSIQKSELENLLQSKEVVSSSVKILDNIHEIKYLREVNLQKNIGFDILNSNQPTSILSVITDEFGNLITAFPGAFK